MKKLIYLEDAIEAVSRGCEELHGTFARCEKNLNELPSVQPEKNLYCQITLSDEQMQEAVENAKNAILQVMSSSEPESEERPLTEDDYAYCAECDHVEMCRWYPMYGCEFKSRPSAESEQRWIPVKMRPMDSGEREYWEGQFGEKLEDEDAVMFDCPMPEDGQEILVSYRKWISNDKCEIDGGCYGLEGNGDWEDVITWMPSPEPYQEDEQE